MKRIRKYLLTGGLPIVILATIGIALILGSRWLTASDAARKKITSEIARLTGGELHYEKLALHLLPLPHLTALQVDFQVPGNVSLETASLAIYPDLAALLSGSFELDDLVIVRPAVKVNLKSVTAKPDSRLQIARQKRLPETMATVFGALGKLGPVLAIEVRNGAVVLIRPGKPELKIEKIDMRLNSRGQVVDLDLDCRSDTSGKMAFKGSVNLETRNSHGRIKLEGLNARALLAELPSLPEITLSDTHSSLDVAFSTRAAEQVKATVICKIPEVRIQRQKRGLALQSVLLKGDIEADPGKLAWDIKALRIDSQGLDLGSSGTFTFGSRISPAVLELDAVGRRINVAAVARSFTDFAGDQAWVPTAFSVAREGQLTKATCHLAVRKTNGKWTVADLKATGQLTGGLITIPGADLDLKEVSGEVALDNQRVDFKQMHGRLLFGTFDQLDARIGWHQAATLGISASRGTLSLEAFIPWLTAFKGLQDIRKFISTADGNLNLTRLELAGPLASPAAWRIEVASDLENVTINSPELNGPLYISRGSASFKPQNLVYENIHLKYLDADAVTSCTLMGKPGHPERLDLSLDGTLGEQALTWIHGFKALPEHLRVKPPLTVRGMRLQWDDPSNVTVVGELSTAGGARAVADAAFAPGRWQINRFELNDGMSKISLKLTKSDQQIDLDYSGKLHKTTLDRLLKENRSLKGWVDGRLKASLNMKNPRSSAITGSLRGEGLIVRRLPVSPIEFERFSLDCRGKSARLESADIVFAGTPMRLEGTAGITEQAYTFDLDLTANSLDAAALSKIQQAPPPGAEKPGTQKKKDLPVNGIIRFKTPRFTFKDYTWSPAHADITVRSDTVKVAVTRADLCGISTPGTVTRTPDGLHLIFEPVAVQKNLQATWECLQDKPLRADIVYSLTGTIEARGPANDLVKNLRGDISFSSDNGMVYRANMLTKIFSFINLTEMFAGKVSGLNEKGFGYDALRSHAAIKAGSLNFDEILLDGHSMKISGLGTVNLVANTLDLNLLVAPLKTFDRVVKNMPVVGYITGGSVLSVPVSIKGSTADPQVVPLPPAAVGRGLMGILERTLKSPLKVVESLPKNDADREAQDAQEAESRKK